MFHALLLSFGQLGDPAIRRVLARSLALTLAIFAALGAAIWWGLDGALAGWRYHGMLAGAAATLATLLALWLLFRAVAVLVVGLFADDVVAAVERRHYPEALASARALPLHRSMQMGLGSATRFLLFNLVMAPVYIALLVTGIGTAAAFFVVNAWLLGRDLSDMVASRHLPRAAMRDWRKSNGGQRFVLGLAGTGLFVVPLVNLLAPVLGAAMATHLFHRTRP
ncbi:EI24 domain-containing protein [Sphingomonas sp. Mn802worker]|uniref:EI24 domain-containing protein n=1 Tax=Sphingomonas sp. Mn802worker TaxID=629773 RepID=UPI00036C7B98|nr:EI24 domain-containing protein [Sphingomonas sp. Mn802worker]